MTLGNATTRTAALTGLLALLAAGGAATAPLPVVVSILPQQEFVRAVGGDEVTVDVLVGPGHSPATYEPTPRQVAGLSAARLFFAAGVPFERGIVPRIAAMPDGPVIAGARDFGPAAARGHDDHGHDHDHGDGPDPHTWLDPVQAMAFADTVCARLTAARPAAAAEFAARRDSLRARLATLDREIAAELAPWRGRAFFVFHPAYGHFARRYGLEQVAVEQDGHDPGARQVAAVVARARAAGATVIVVQPQFSRRTAEAIAREVGAEILVLDPLAADYETSLRHIAAALAASFASAR